MDTGVEEGSRERESTFVIPINYFHQLTSIEKFICSYAYKMPASYFNRNTFIYQTVNLFCPPYRWLSLIELVFDWASIAFC